jgi:hypothetical protein
MEQYGSPPPQPQSLEAAASEFRSRVEDAATRLNSAAEQFVAMSDSLLAAVEEARQAAYRAQAAQHAVEDLRDRMARDYGSVSDLVRDMQMRIGALATLAQPLPNEQPASSQPINSGYSSSQGETSW